jgi:hypothetical protein
MGRGKAGRECGGQVRGGSQRVRSADRKSGSAGAVVRRADPPRTGMPMRRRRSACAGEQTRPVGGGAVCPRRRRRSGGILPLGARISANPPRGSCSRLTAFKSRRTEFFAGHAPALSRLVLPLPRGRRPVPRGAHGAGARANTGAAERDLMGEKHRVVRSSAAKVTGAYSSTEYTAPVITSGRVVINVAGRSAGCSAAPGS